MTTSCQGSSRRVFQYAAAILENVKTLGTSFPKYSLRACYSDPLILSPMMNNFVFVVSFCTFSTQPGCIFDHLRIYRKIDSKKGSSSTNGSNLPSFSSIRGNATFRVQYISYIFQIYKKSFLKLGMLMKFRLRILCPLSLNSYNKNASLKLQKGQFVLTFDKRRFNNLLLKQQHPRFFFFRFPSLCFVMIKSAFFCFL